MSQTIRGKMIERLSEEEMGANDLSRHFGIREKEVYDHLAHIRRSMIPRGKKLFIRPARCLSCGFVFQDRRRLTPPGRCPRCRKTYLSSPTYRIG